MLLYQFYRTSPKIILIYELPALQIAAYIEKYIDTRRNPNSYIMLDQSAYMDQVGEINYNKLNEHIQYLRNTSVKTIFLVFSIIDTEELIVKINKTCKIKIQTPTLLDDTYIPENIRDEINELIDAYNIEGFDHMLSLDDIKELEYATRVIIANNKQDNDHANDEFESILRNTMIPLHYNNDPNGISLYIEDIEKNNDVLFSNF